MAKCGSAVAGVTLSQVLGLSSRLLSGLLQDSDRPGGPAMARRLAEFERSPPPSALVRTRRSRAASRARAAKRRSPTPDRRRRTPRRPPSAGTAACRPSPGGRPRRPGQSRPSACLRVCHAPAVWRRTRPMAWRIPCSCRKKAGASLSERACPKGVWFITYPPSSEPTQRRGDYKAA